MKKLTGTGFLLLSICMASGFFTQLGVASEEFSYRESDHYEIVFEVDPDIEGVIRGNLKDLFDNFTKFSGKMTPFRKKDVVIGNEYRFLLPATEESIIRKLDLEYKMRNITNLTIKSY